MDKFKIIKEEIKFEKKIKNFEEDYKKNTDNENINKNTVLNLSFTLFHMNKGKGESKNTKETHPKKKEPLIFECFKDEIN